MKEAILREVNDEVNFEQDSFSIVPDLAISSDILIADDAKPRNSKRQRNRQALLKNQPPESRAQKEKIIPIREDEEISFHIPPQLQEKRMNYGSSGQDIIHLLMEDMEKYPLLTPEQEKYAFGYLKDGKTINDLKNDQTFLSLGAPKTEEKMENAINESKNLHEFLASCNLRLVISIAKRYQNRGLQLEDLIQIGTMGLMRALDKFDVDKPQKDDPSKTHKFSTYATWWIRQSITRELADTSGAIRIPVHIHEGISSASKHAERFFSENNRNPKAWEMRKLLMQDPEMTRSQADLIIRTLQSFVGGYLPSLDRDIVSSKDEYTLGDIVPDAKANVEETAVERVGRQDIRNAIANALQQLPERDREVLILRFGLNDGKTRTLDEVAVNFAITRERIRQIESRAINFLRKNKSLENSYFVGPQTVLSPSLADKITRVEPVTEQTPARKMYLSELIDLASEYVDVWNIFDSKARSILKLYHRTSDKEEAKGKISKIFKMSSEEVNELLANCSEAISLVMQGALMPPKQG